MAESIDFILDFLKRNQFTKAEAALRGELSSRLDVNGLTSTPLLEPNDLKLPLQGEKHNEVAAKRADGGARSIETSGELIVKEVECRTSRNGSDYKWKVGSENTLSDLYLLNFDLNERNSVRKDDVAIANNFSELKISTRPLLNPHSLTGLDSKNSAGMVNSGDGTESDLSREKKIQWFGGINKLEGIDQSKKTNTGYSIDQPVENPWSFIAGSTKTSFGTELESSSERKLSWIGSTSRAGHSSQSGKSSGNFTIDQPLENQWGSKKPSSDTWKECSVVKTVFPFPTEHVDFDTIIGPSDNRKEGDRKSSCNDIRVELKEQVDEVGRSLFLGKYQGSSEQNNVGCLDLVLVNENHTEELPRLPPVKLKSEDKLANIHWEEKVEHRGSGMKMVAADMFLIGSFLDIPVGQEINSSGAWCVRCMTRWVPRCAFDNYGVEGQDFTLQYSQVQMENEGGKRAVGSSWLSVSQGIAEDASDLVSGFATVGDGLSESIDYPNEYWDSDEYDDDEDVGYMRQPIEDEAWFLAHEIDYPSDNEKGTARGSVPDPNERGATKDEDDDQSFAEEDSYFSGEQLFQSKNIGQVATTDDPMGLSMMSMCGRRGENDMIAQYDGHLMDEEELNLMRAEPVWQGFVTQNNELILLCNERVLNECEQPQPDDPCMDDDQHGSVRSIGVGINSDAADIGSEVLESLIGGSSEGDVEYFCDNDVGISSSKHSQCETSRSLERPNLEKVGATEQNVHRYSSGPEKSTVGLSYNDGGFSFPPPLRTVDGIQSESRKTLWSSKGDKMISEKPDEKGDGEIGPDDMLATWQQKSCGSSPVKSSSRDENIGNAVPSNSTSTSEYDDNGKEHFRTGQDDKVCDAREEDPGATLEDEEAVAVQEQVRQIKAQEEEFETFTLKIVHRKNRQVFFSVLQPQMDEANMCLYMKPVGHGDVS
ncbi:hypothetical protein ACLOJK_006757 [Asimina triloba]